MAEEHEPRRLTDEESRAAAARRIQQQATWVDLQVRQAIERGDFDDLPGTGKPLDLGEEHDPDWWVKRLIERERIVVLPPSVQLRKEDAELDELLDAQPSERAARALVEDFNTRVIAARYRLPEGPPLVTMPRDVDATMEAWRERREARRAEQRRLLARDTPARRRWWQSRRG
jgi:hypothetical protein